MIPKTFNKEDFALFFNNCINDDEKEMLTSIFFENKEDKKYYFCDSTSINFADIANLLINISARIAAISPDMYISEFNKKIVANFFCRYRNNMKRKSGDTGDDYYKAVYLLELVDFFRRKKTRVVLLRYSDELLKSTIQLVYNIFDRAFFLKIDFPYKTDIQCFTEAEREYCKEKMIEYEIEKAAYFKSQERAKKRLPPDPEGDYFEALDEAK